MIDHMVKKELDRITGLRFSPVIGMSASYPIASYQLSETTRVGTLHEAVLEVSLQGEDYDEILALVDKIKKELITEPRQPNRRLGAYSVRAALAYGAYIRWDEAGYVDSSTYFNIRYFEMAD